MKHSIAVKFIAILLCAISVVGIAFSGFGILYMEANNLYSGTLEDRKQQQLEGLAMTVAWSTAERYAAEKLGNCPLEILDDILGYSNVTSDYAVQIREKGALVHSINEPEDILRPYKTSFTFAPNYPMVSYQYTVGEDGTRATEMPPEQTLPDLTGPTEAPDPAQETQPVQAPTEATENPVYTSEHTDEFWDESGELNRKVYTLNYFQGPEYEVTVYLAEQTVLGSEFALMSVLYPYRDMFLPIVLMGLLLFAATFVFLCSAAGRTADGRIVPAGLNRMPLDLYAALVGGGLLALLFLVEAVMNSYYNGYYGIWDNLPLCMALLCAGVFGASLLTIGWLFALVAQIKAREGFWWKRSVCGFVLRQVMSFALWIRRGLRYVYRGCRAVVRLMPLIWQWLLTAAVMVVVPIFFLLLTVPSHGVMELFWGMMCILAVLADVAMVCYGGWCFGTLFKGVRTMSRGDLNHQIPEKNMFAVFREFAQQLNSVAGAAQIAAEKQMKSERMKAELVTNVSHDIKTPLTSIINYVDLLKKAHSDEEAKEYLEVLDRQSLRLKKLIDDLMEMSKASTGNINVEFGEIDAVEAVNQALGEFADKLARVKLVPVFRHPDFPVIMRADGKLVWRVLSNILNNAVKYAMPDTRLYVDLMVLQGNAVIAVKNISRDQLNVNAEELMERFVRGDASRNTEGSGLGLNIAKSLVEIQQGQMHLMVDGDLFKVTLIFPLV